MSDDKKNAALRRIDEAPVRARQTWRHVKGGVYSIVAVGIDEARLEPVVVYVGHDGIVWTRDLDVFLGEKDGAPRFTQTTWQPTDGFEALPEVRP